MTLDAPNPLQLLAEERRVRALARRLAVDGDELVQESLLRVLEGGALALREPRAWLARIARNVAHNLRREERHRAARERRAARPERVPSSAELALREERRAALIAAVDALPAPLREVVWLRFFEGLPPRRIAQELGVAAMTVSNRLRRALQLLRARLDAEHGDRRAWLLPLCVPGPRSGVTVAATTGVIAMTKTKIFAAAAALLVLAVTYAWWPAPVPLPDAPELADAARMTTPVAPASNRWSATPMLAPRETVPAAATASPTTGDLLVRVRYADDHTSAAGVTMIAWRSTGDSRVDGCRVQTDAAGEARFLALPPRAYRLISDRGMLGELVEVRAGETVELEYEIEAGLDLSGIVIDAAGAPVADASIEVGTHGANIHDAEVVARSGSDGRFLVRSAPRRCVVGARAAGFAASAVRLVTGRAGNRADVTLELKEPGGVIEGTVVDAQGAPIAGAVVVAGDGAIRVFTGRDPMPPMPALVRTDAEGRFRAVGLAAGTWPVRVRAAELAPWQGTCDVVIGRPAMLAVTLSPGATVRGIVHGASGATVHGAEVEVGTADDIAYTHAFTAADGSFELRGLAAGEARLAAAHAALGKASLAVRTEAGAVTECTLQLSRGVELRGRVLDENGAPVAGALISCTGEAARSGWSHWMGARTEDDGRFAVGNCPEQGTLTVTVGGEGIEEARRTHVDPAGGELVLRVRRALPASVRIRGRILDPEGAPIANASTTALRAGANTASGPEIAYTAEDGSFELGPLPPGPRGVLVRARDFPLLRTEVRELAADAHWDLGEVCLPRGGRVVVQLAAGDPAGVELAAADPGVARWVWHAAATAEPLRSDPLPAGDCVLLVSGSDIAAQSIPFTVRAGEDTTIEVRVEPGIRQRVELALPGASEAVAGVDLRVESASALVACKYVVVPSGAPPSTELWLASGRYTVTARAGAWQGRAECTVGSEEAEPLRIALQ